MTIARIWARGRSIKKRRPEARAAARMRLIVITTALGSGAALASGAAFARNAALGSGAAPGSGAAVIPG